MDMTRERISLIFELSAIFLTFQMVLSLASAAVAWAILARISGLDPSSAMIAPRYLNDVTCHQVIATKYGEGVLIRHGSGRAGNVACFQLWYASLLTCYCSQSAVFLSVDTSTRDHTNTLARRYAWLVSEYK